MRIIATSSISTIFRCGEIEAWLMGSMRRSTSEWLRDGIVPTDYPSQSRQIGQTC